jgi:SAM-dependent methyltransferase
MESGLKRRARRAIERQLDYQRAKAERIRGGEGAIVARMIQHSTEIAAKLGAVRAIAPDARVLEVGSGAHGLIFFFPSGERIGVDPLADHYRELFPMWQGKARTIAGSGEHLPFPDASFDVVLCDNVVDHAESPREICEEIVRVLKPGGLLYFTVNVHHPIYHWAATIHAGWRALGIPVEITPFADHTVHLTLGAAKRLFDGIPLKFARESDTIKEAIRAGRELPPRHVGDRVKRWFFKNAHWEIVGVREKSTTSSRTAGRERQLAD